MTITADRHGGNEYVSVLCFEDAGLGDPAATAQLTCTSGRFKAKDDLSVFDLRRPWMNAFEGPGSDIAGHTFYKTVSGAPLPSLVAYYRDNARTLLVYTKALTYDTTAAALPTQVIHRTYMPDGVTVRATCTETVTYSGAAEISRVRAFS